MELRCSFCSSQLQRGDDSIFITNDNKLMCRTCKDIRDSFIYSVSGEEIDVKKWKEIIIKDAITDEDLRKLGINPNKEPK